MILSYFNVNAKCIDLLLIQKIKIYIEIKIKVRPKYDLKT